MRQWRFSSGQAAEFGRRYRKALDALLFDRYMIVRKIDWRRVIVARNNGYVSLDIIKIPRLLSQTGQPHV